MTEIETISTVNIFPTQDLYLDDCFMVRIILKIIFHHSTLLLVINYYKSRYALDKHSLFA